MALCNRSQYPSRRRSKVVNGPAVSEDWLRYHVCCQDDSVNCHCFAKDKMKLKALFDPCACTSQDEYCTTELCLSVDKLRKKKNKRQRRQQQGRDCVSVQMSMSM